MRVSADVRALLGLELGALVSGASRPEDPHPDPLPWREGEEQRAISDEGSGGA